MRTLKITMAMSSLLILVGAIAIGHFAGSYILGFGIFAVCEGLTAGMMVPAMLK